MKKLIIMVAITALLLLIVGLPTAIASDVSRTIPSGEQAPNTDIEIMLTVTLDSGETYYSIDEVIPDGLTIMDAGTGDTTETGHIKWVVIQGATSTTYTYTVQGTDGTYNINGIYQIEGMTTPDTIHGNTVLTIDDGGLGNVCRAIPSGDQIPDVDIPISLEVTVDGATYYAIDEVIPYGLTITDPGTGDTSDPGHIKWVVTTGATDTVYTYKVQGPIGTYTFSNGLFQIEGMLVPSTIDCNTNLVIDDTCPCDFCFELEPGWNMVSIPKAIEGSNTATHVFKLGNGEVCLRYDPTVTPNLNPWEQFPNIIPCEGYMVYKQSDSTDYSVCVNFVNEGNSVPPELPLYKGWNLIGHPDVTSTSVDNFASFTGLSDTMTQLWHRSNDGTWTGYPDWDLISVTPGQGYWAFLTADTKMAGTP